MFDQNKHINATYESVAHMDHYIETVDQMRTDPEKEQRERKKYCKWCYYMSFAGVDDTKPCMVCGVDVYGRNKVCLKCAQEHRLCVRYGGDLDMRPRRRKW